MLCSWDSPGACGVAPLPSCDVLASLLSLSKAFALLARLSRAAGVNDEKSLP